MNDVILGIAKKWLEALKMDRFTADTFDCFLNAFKTILTPQPSAECLRSLAMFITYARHTPRKRELSPLRPSKSTAVFGEPVQKKQTLITTSSLNPSISDANLRGELDRGQIALRVMELYTSLICDRNDMVTTKKFARIVTNRVGISSNSSGLYDWLKVLSGYCSFSQTTSQKLWS